MFFKNKFPYPFGGILFLLGAWFAISHLQPQPNIYFPTPEETFVRLSFLLTSGLVIQDVASTLFRTLVSFIFSLTFALPIAILLGINEKVFKIFEFLFDFFRSLPAVALLPLFLLILGITDTARIALASFTGFWIISVSILYGVMHMKQTRLDISKVMKATRMRQFIDVVFWEILPSIFSGIKLALPIIFIIILTTEMVAPPRTGLGVRIIEYQTYYKTPEVYALIIIMGTLGYILNKCLVLLEKKVIHWTKY